MNIDIYFYIVFLESRSCLAQFRTKSRYAIFLEVLISSMVDRFSSGYDGQAPFTLLRSGTFTVVDWLIGKSLKNGKSMTKP